MYKFAIKLQIFAYFMKIALDSIALHFNRSYISKFSCESLKGKRGF